MWGQGDLLTLQATGVAFRRLGHPPGSFSTFQTNYSAANGFIDEFIRQRRKNKLSGNAINWGNWLEVGMAERSGVNAYFKSMGFAGLSTKDAMKYFRYIIESNPERILVAKIDWPLFLKYRHDARALVEGNQYLKNDESAFDHARNEADQEVRLLAQTTAASEVYFTSGHSTKDDFHHYLLAKLNSLMSELTDEDPQPSIPTWDAYKEGFSVNVVDLFEHNSIHKLANFIWINLKCVDRASFDGKQDEKNSPVNYEAVDVCLKHISDHIVEGEVIVPAAYQIYFFEQHLRSTPSHSGQHFYLTDLKFTNKVKMSHLNHLQISASGHLNLRLHVHLNTFSSCTYSHAKPPVSTLQQHFPNQPIRIANYYTQISESGINYGPSLRVLENVYYSPAANCIQATVKQADFPYWVLYDLGGEKNNQNNIQNHKNNQEVETKNSF
uniref:Ketoreductase (KR) domain-containing protein n=1 Tax=Ditylenchus dipsaci TaxID=166011 RepID=A0A915DW56_9BILA